MKKQTSAKNKEGITSLQEKKQQNKSYKLGTTAGVLGAICQEWQHRPIFMENILGGTLLGGKANKILLVSGRKNFFMLKSPLSTGFGRRNRKGNSDIRLGEGKGK